MTFNLNVSVDAACNYEQLEGGALDSCIAPPPTSSKIKRRAKDDPVGISPASQSHRCDAFRQVPFVGEGFGCRHVKFQEEGVDPIPLRAIADCVRAPQCSFASH